MKEKHAVVLTFLLLEYCTFGVRGLRARLLVSKHVVVSHDSRHYREHIAENVAHFVAARITPFVVSRVVRLARAAVKCVCVCVCVGGGGRCERGAIKHIYRERENRHMARVTPTKWPRPFPYRCSFRHGRRSCCAGGASEESQRARLRK